jgi:hypothetical protein
MTGYSWCVLYEKRLRLSRKVDECEPLPVHGQRVVHSHQHPEHQPALEVLPQVEGFRV